MNKPAPAIQPLPRRWPFTRTVRAGALLALLAAAPPGARAQTAPDAAPGAASQDVAALTALYRLAATAHVCDLDVTDEEDDKLQEAVDRAEDAAEASGLKPDARDAMWNAIVAEIVLTKDKSCAEASSSAIGQIRALKE